jgi:hypothetical protein
MRAVLRQLEPYPDLVDTWVRESVFGGVRGFDDLLRNLPGIYPQDVSESLRRLSQDGALPQSLAARLLPGAFYLGPTTLTHPQFSVPHPLDYDWRFTSSTSAYLLQEAAKVRRPRDTLVCLGTPSVYHEAVRQGGFHRPALVDANSAVVRHFLRKCRSALVYNCDLLTDKIPLLQAPVIVSDPPWYFDHMAAFLWAAFGICTIGGHVLMSLPPRGTRPGIADELRRFLGLAHDLGFDLVRHVEGSLRYDSPPFERNALRAAGIRLASYDWRCGDLYVFQFRSVRRLARPRFCGTRPRWADEELSGMRVRLRTNGVTTFASPLLVPVVEGDVLPSVSSRHPMRALVDVWTAGNRVFRCAGTDIMSNVIRALVRGQDPAFRVAFSLDRELTAREQKLVEVAAEQVTALAKSERSDFCFAGVG